MPGLGTTFGRGGATTFLQDLQNADCIVIEGSNFAECHPVGFRFVMKAKERGAKIIHVDPRFTRTSALADVYAPIRSGTDIVFLGALINWVLQSGRYFHEYVASFTNAANILCQEFADTEDLGGLFSGFGAQTDASTTSQALEGAAESRRDAAEPKAYDDSTWRYERDENDAVRTDRSLRHPRCVLQVLKRHFSRYTPQMVESVCGTPRAQFEQIAEIITSNSGRERTTAFAYAVGWTQHTVGVQYIRTAAILQLLLGNIGRPGGGIMALRGHANIQGATDIATLYDLLPGYLPMPAVERDEQTLAAYIKTNTKRDGYWSNFPSFIVSLLKAFYGDAATAANGYCFEYLPQLTGDHSTLPTQVAMKDGLVKGYFVIGQNPGASGLHAQLVCAALERLDWMVNVDSYETETASFWMREGADPTTIATECFFIPAATVLEKEGTMTNTSRTLQWHDKAVEPAGRSVTDLWFVHQLGLALKSLYAQSTDPKDRPILDLVWDYPHESQRERQRGEPSARKVLQEINGYVIATGEQLKAAPDIKGDGSTACGAWIYTGVFPDRTTNRARSRQADGHVSPDWGYSWPANRRMLYNRASADADGKPWSERKRYVWWDEAQCQWTGADVPDFPLDKHPHSAAIAGEGGMAAHTGSSPFIMQHDGLGQLFVAAGLKDGPLPVHYEPLNSVVDNALYAQQHNPVLREWKRKDNRYNGHRNAAFPHVLTTYRLTEQSGIMTRYIPWLAELQPVLFCEIDPQLAVERGIHNGEWCTISTAVGEVEARALVSGRMKPLHIGATDQSKGTRVHQIGLPYNFGPMGFSVGDSAGNLIALSMDPNVSIHEAKTLTCAIRPGRRTRNRRTAANEPVPPDQRTPEGQPTLHGVDG